MHRTLALLSALLLAGGCSDDGDRPPPAATVPSEVTTSSTAPAPDPAVIPDDLAEIDEEYVQAVVDELFAVDAKATELFVTTKTLDERAIDYLEAIYVGEELDQQVDVWFQALAHRADELRVGTLQNDVQQLIHVGSDCVFFEVERDYSDTTTREDPPRRVIHLGLTPKRQNDDPARLNPSGWMIFTSSVAADGSGTENPCEGR